MSTLLPIMARIQINAVQVVAAVATSFTLMAAVPPLSSSRSASSDPAIFFASATCTGTAGAPAETIKTLVDDTYQVRAACAVNDVMYAFPGTIDWFTSIPDTKVWTWSLLSGGLSDFTPTKHTLTGIDTTANGYVEDCVSDGTHIYLVYREAGAGVGLVSTAQRIYKLDPMTLVATPIAGVSGIDGATGKNCDAAAGTWDSALTDTTFYQMGGIALSPTQDRLIVVGKCSNSQKATIRSIALDSSVVPQVVRLAGDTSASVPASDTLADGTGTAARILNPRGLAAGSGSSRNKFFFVDAEDASTGKLRVFDLSDNSITTLSAPSTSSTCVSSESVHLSNLCLKGKLDNAHLGYSTSSNGNWENSKISQGDYGYMVLTDKFDAYLVNPETLEAALIHSTGNSNYFTAGSMPRVNTNPSNPIGAHVERYVYLFRRGNWNYQKEPETYDGQVRRLGVSLDEQTCSVPHCSPANMIPDASNPIASMTGLTSPLADTGIRSMINVDGTIYAFPRRSMSSSQFNKMFKWDATSSVTSITSSSISIHVAETGYDGKNAHVESLTYGGSEFAYFFLGFVEHGTTAVNSVPIMVMRLSDNKLRRFAGAKTVVGGNLNCDATSIDPSSTTFMHTRGLALGQDDQWTLYALGRCNPLNTASIRSMRVKNKGDATKGVAGSVSVVAGHHDGDAATAAPVDGLGTAATIVNPFGMVKVIPIMYFLDAQLGSAPVLRSFNPHNGLVSTISSATATTVSTSSASNLGLGFSLNQLHLTNAVTSETATASSIWASSTSQPRLETSGNGELVIIDGPSAFVAIPGTGSVYRLDTSSIDLGHTASLGAAVMRTVDSDNQQLLFATQKSSTASSTTSDEIHISRISVAKGAGNALCDAPRTASCTPLPATLSQKSGSLSGGQDISIKTFCSVGNKGFAFFRSVGLSGLATQSDTPTSVNQFYSYDLSSSGGMNLQTMTGLDVNHVGFVSSCHTIGSKIYLGFSSFKPSWHSSSIAPIYEFDPETYVVTPVAGDSTGTVTGSGLNCDLTSWTDASTTNFALVTGLSSSADGKILYVLSRCKTNGGAGIRSVDLTHATKATTLIVGDLTDDTSPLDGTGTAVRMSNPVHLVKGVNGDHYFLDGQRNGLYYGTWLRKWVPSSNTVTTVDLTESGMDLGRNTFGYTLGWPFMTRSCDCRDAALADPSVLADAAEVNLATTHSDSTPLIISLDKSLYVLDVNNMVFHPFATIANTFTALSVDRFGQVWSATQPTTTGYNIYKQELGHQLGNSLCRTHFAAVATETSTELYTPVNVDQGGQRIMEATIGYNVATGTRFYAGLHKDGVVLYDIDTTGSVGGALTSTTATDTSPAGIETSIAFALQDVPVLYASMRSTLDTDLGRIDLTTWNVETVTSKASGNSNCAGGSSVSTDSPFTMGSTKSITALALSTDGTHLMAHSCRAFFRVQVSATAGANHVTTFEGGKKERDVLDGVGTEFKTAAARGMAQAATGIWYFIDIADADVDGNRNAYIRSLVPSTTPTTQDSIVTTIGINTRWNTKVFTDRAMNLYELPLVFKNSMYYSMDRVSASSNWLCVTDATHMYLIDVSAPDAHNTLGAAKAYSLVQVDAGDALEHPILSADFDTPTSFFITQRTTGRVPLEDFLQ